MVEIVAGPNEPLDLSKPPEGELFNDGYVLGGAVVGGIIAGAVIVRGASSRNNSAGFNLGPAISTDPLQRAQDAQREWARLNKQIIYPGHRSSTNPIESVREKEEGTRVAWNGKVVPEQARGYHRSPGLEGYGAWLQAFQVLDTGLSPNHQGSIDRARTILAQLNETVAMLEKPRNGQLTAYRNARLEELERTGETFLLTGHKSHFNIVRIRRLEDGSYTHTLYDSGHETRIVGYRNDERGRSRAIANAVEERIIRPGTDLGVLITAEAGKISTDADGKAYKGYKEYIERATAGNPYRVVEEFAQRRGNCTTRGQRLLIDDIIGDEKVSARLREFITDGRVSTRNIQQSLAEREQQLRARPVAPTQNEKVYVDNSGHRWANYSSSEPSLGESLRYSREFANLDEAHSFCMRMKNTGINAVPAKSGDHWYAYIPKHDQVSVQRLQASLTAVVITPEPPPHQTAPAKEPSFLARAKAWLGFGHTPQSPHENAPHGKGVVAGTALAVTAGAGALVMGASPAEAAVITGEQALSAIPGVSGLLADNPDEARIRNRVDALGLTGAVAGAWVGGIAGTPLPVAGNAAGVVGGGALGNLLLSMGSDELLRLSARYIEGKKDTVHPSAGEQIITSAFEAGKIGLEELKKQLETAQKELEKTLNPMRRFQVGEAPSDQPENLRIAQAKASAIERPEGVVAAANPEMVAQNTTRLASQDAERTRLS